ncbi:diaminopimelate epimerase [Wenzhouxiangella sp. XN24]|uniref:diaminopimelate epimerase n=1 Tax=Wenzhouxiangella sp. XN24 TaxID=2713569 RepID=UPI0013ECC70C|nr:diaminopimelate epimerase [Wenzhouxiangella sp. XN24]NGX17349.1 diaminopimelate epimerase [Wenzhouxiangella sp. XN24]
MRQTSVPSAGHSFAFHKMVGAGNDFVVVDARTRPFTPDADLVRWIADRRNGVGCDQLLAIDPAPDGEAAFAYRIWNADGGEVAQCGNGARCLALLWATELAPVQAQTQAQAQAFRMSSAAGPVEARVAGGAAAVSMGVPEFRPHLIPLHATSEATRYTIGLGDRSVRLGAVSMGNPHAVIVLEELGETALASAPVTTLGPAIERHPAFPERANVGFVQLLARDRVALRVWERGVGETLACGTGACAAVAVLADQGAVNELVNVDLPGGRLVVEWQGRGTPAWLSGPAGKVFEGKISL